MLSGEKKSIFFKFQFIGSTLESNTVYVMVLVFYVIISLDLFRFLSCPVLRLKCSKVYVTLMFLLMKVFVEPLRENFDILFSHHFYWLLYCVPDTY